MWKFFDTAFDRIFAVLGALLFSQGPAFIGQYMQRLGGGVQELKRQVHFLEGKASNAGLSVSEYIGHFTRNDNAVISGQGEFLSSLMERYASLQSALQTLGESSAWERPIAFVKTLQGEIAYSTFQNFKPALTLTLEGILYASVGVAVGVVFYRILRKPFKRQHVQSQ